MPPLRCGDTGAKVNIISYSTISFAENFGLKIEEKPQEMEWVRALRIAGQFILRYSVGDIPTRLVNRRVKCCGYLNPSR